MKITLLIYSKDVSYITNLFVFWGCYISILTIYIIEYIYIYSNNYISVQKLVFSVANIFSYVNKDKGLLIKTKRVSMIKYDSSKETIFESLANLDIYVETILHGIYVETSLTLESITWQNLQRFCSYLNVTKLPISIDYA